MILGLEVVGRGNPALGEGGRELSKFYPVSLGTLRDEQGLEQESKGRREQGQSVSVSGGWYFFLFLRWVSL